MACDRGRAPNRGAPQLVLPDARIRYLVRAVAHETLYAEHVAWEREREGEWGSGEWGRGVRKKGGRGEHGGRGRMRWKGVIIARTVARQREGGEYHGVLE